MTNVRVSYKDWGNDEPGRGKNAGGCGGGEGGDVADVVSTVSLLSPLSRLFSLTYYCHQHTTSLLRPLPHNKDH